MSNYYVLDIQSNEESSGVIPYGYADKGEAEGAYLALRESARQSDVLVHTVMWIDNKGNIIEKKEYIHPVE